MGELFRQAVHFDRTLVNDQGTDCNTREGKGEMRYLAFSSAASTRGPAQAGPFRSAMRHQAR